MRFFPLVSALAVLFLMSPAVADVPPPQLNGCAVRPPGAPCFINGVERGVCVEDTGTGTRSARFCAVTPSATRELSPASAAPSAASAQPMSADSAAPPRQSGGCSYDGTWPGESREWAIVVMILMLYSRRSLSMRSETPLSVQSRTSF